MHVVFVILHYITTEDTILCVKSINKNVDYNDYSIVIVDNGSKNHSYEKLNEHFSKSKNIYIIRSEENLGFAKGNNMGIKYAKDKLEADFVVIINNDTLIMQNNFINKIINVYNKEAFYILGPDIISTKDNGHQNPHRNKIASLKYARKMVIEFGMNFLFSYIYLDVLIYKIKNLFFSNKDLKHSNDDSNKEELVLHGSCLVFSPKYLKKFSGIYNNTFMYGEEEILFYICKRLNLKVIYEPSIKILHKEGSATKTVYNKNFKKRNFYYKNKFKSSLQLYKIILQKDKIENLLGGDS
ncbi:putative glycosyl transferase [Clostridium bornimense]|uniref:Putative glycosyl transferase n=1 Tax=Clostridium bornimense TaxID=1216932 RepID=W6RUG8_9CLOT|nr:glycosyltransferase [Clostridium bornimense]CDM67938.1 putative glycosyl transferase [Clostridium bornimense]